MTIANKPTPDLTQQPRFVEDLVAAVENTLKDVALADDLITIRPDYTKPINLDNLFRTSMYVGQANTPPTTRILHISNLVYENDTKVIVFEENPFTKNVKRVTWHYQSPTQMAMKDHPVQFIGFRSSADMHLDIADFLANGKFPT